MKRIIIYLLVFTSNLVISQEYKLGKVTIEELKETEHKLEKDANACKIFSKAKTFMVYNNDRGFELVIKSKYTRRMDWVWPIFQLNTIIMLLIKKMCFFQMR
jgi:hypothetical protein